MVSFRWSTLLPCLFLGSLLASPVACGGDDDDDGKPGVNAGSGGSGTGGSGSNGNGSQPANNCANRCGAIAGRCGAPATLCVELCANATESQLACAEAAGCDSEAINRCQASGSSGGTGALPDTITVSGKRKPGNEPIHVLNSDQTELATNLNGAATITYSFAAAQGQLKLQDAASKSVTAPASPSVAECAGIASINVTLNATEFGYVFVGVDTLPATGCLDFGDAAHQNGLTMRFTDVPMLNGSQKVKEVIVNVDP